jgi:diguanylate cyclase (GGDEF)-like protein
VVFDVDHFKSFNDRFGHIAGDRCLKTIARLINGKARRPGDIAARIGGDEFILVLTRVSNSQAQSIVDGICRKVDELNVMINTCERVSISAGIATMRPSGVSNDFQTLYYNADQNLYAAKHQRSSINSA